MITPFSPIPKAKTGIRRVTAQKTNLDYSFTPSSDPRLTYIPSSTIPTTPTFEASTVEFNTANQQFYDPGILEYESNSLQFESPFPVPQNDLLYESESNFAFESPFIGIPSSQQQFTQYMQNFGNVSSAPPSKMYLRSVEEIPEQYRNMFSFPFFNKMQSLCIDSALYSSANLVVSAPTSSGKTVIMELAIIGVLMQFPKDTIKIVYVAPTKALCSERFLDWSNKFGMIKCKEITGDTFNDNVYESLKQSHLIITTPEKWDSITRKWREYKRYLELICLFLIDEVHILNEERGATLEAVVSRMKTIGRPLRFVAISATVPNILDISKWIGLGQADLISQNEMHDRVDLTIPTDQSNTAYAITKVFGEAYRPVQLKRYVYGYPEKTNPFLFDYSLNYRLLEIIEKHADRKPVLVFCNTRKSAQKACEVLCQEIRKKGENFKFTINQQESSVDVTFHEKKLQEYTKAGIAFHHAGLDGSDRQIVESLFIKGDITVVCTTSTLAVGVNLPAHLVVVKSTQNYYNSKYEECSELDILQMIGRAGRPQFDVSGVAVIMTTKNKVKKYEELVKGSETIESNMKNKLIEHLNAEVSLSTIRDIPSAIEWLKSTFLYVRIMSNPGHYLLKRLSANEQSNQRILESVCITDLEKLDQYGMINMDTENNLITTTSLGKIMARYYVAFPTMVQISSIRKHATISEILEAISKANEFEDIHFHQGEKGLLNDLTQNKSIRYPIKCKIQSVDQKIFLMVQATLAGIPYSSSKFIHHALVNQELALVIKTSQRIAKCIQEVEEAKQDPVGLENTIYLHRCLKLRMWEDSPLILKQIDKIGNAFATTLNKHGINTLGKLRSTDARKIEFMLKRNPPFGDQIHDIVDTLPQFCCVMEKKSTHATTITYEVKFSVGNKNVRTEDKNGVPYRTSVLISTTDQKFMVYKRYSFYQLCQGTSFMIEHDFENIYQQIVVKIICEDFIGLDVVTIVDSGLPIEAFTKKRIEAESSFDKLLDEDFEEKWIKPKKRTFPQPEEELGNPHTSNTVTYTTLTPFSIISNGDGTWVILDEHFSTTTTSNDQLSKN